MDNYTVKERKMLSNIELELLEQLNIQKECYSFKKYISPVNKDVTIELVKPIVLRKQMNLYIEIINSYFKFKIVFYDKYKKEYTIYWYIYLREKYNREIKLHKKTSRKYISWIVSEIKKSINEDRITVSISKQGKASYNELICLQQVLKECKILEM